MEGALQPVTNALAKKPIRIRDIVDVRTTVEVIKRSNLSRGEKVVNI